jgi:hypothetical protein
MDAWVLVGAAKLKKAELTKLRPLGRWRLPLLFLLSTIWCCQLAYFPATETQPREAFYWLEVVLGVWILLAVGYCCCRLFVAMALHGVGLVAYSPMISIATYGGRYSLVGWLVAFGALFGSLLSFPYAFSALVGGVRQQDFERRHARSISLESILLLLLMGTIWYFQYAYSPFAHAHSRTEFCSAGPRIVMGAWALLALYYRSHGVCDALGLHLAGIVFVGPMIAFWMFASALNLAEASLLASKAFYVGSLISFPTAVFVLMGGVVRKIAVRRHARSITRGTIPSFLLVGAVWCCQLAVFLLSDFNKREGCSWPGVVLAAWVLLAFFYIGYELFTPTRVHFAGVVIFGAVIARAAVAGDISLETAGRAIAGLGFLGSLASYPCAVYVTLRRSAALRSGK